MANDSSDKQSDHFMMRMALSLAETAYAFDEVPVGAVVVSQNKVIGAAFNLREHLHNPCAHAELLAVTQAATHTTSWRLAQATLYVTLEPCLMCAGAIQQARISRVVFAAADPKAGALGSLYNIHQDSRLNHRFEVEAGVCAAESATLLKRFFASRRK